VPRLYVFLVLVAACAHGFATGDDHAIRDVLASQQEAWNRADLTAFMAGYLHDDSLVFTSGGKIRRGWQDTFDKYRAKYGGAPATMGHLDFEILSVQPLGADGAIVLGRWKLTATPNAGGGVFSLGFVRTSDGWRIAHDHTSIDTAP
jgi:uncharacterized protein (TIGR02246 family)